MINNPAINTIIGSGNTGASTFQRFVANFLSLGIGVGGIVFLFMLLYGGLSFILARGDKEAVSRASRTMTQAIIGLVILLSIFVIVRLIDTIFGTDLLSPVIPTV